MFHVIDNLKENELLQEMALESVKGYGLSAQHVQRETFALMVRHLYKLKQFKGSMLELVGQVARDDIVLVRIALAISVGAILEESPGEEEVFGGVVETLKADEADVSDYLTGF